jgi:hypothetical protein
MLAFSHLFDFSSSVSNENNTKVLKSDGLRFYEYIIISWDTESDSFEIVNFYGRMLKYLEVILVDELMIKNISIKK